MRNIFLFIAITFISGSVFGQLIPERNDDALILQNKVKTSSSYYNDEDSNQNHLIQKLEYNTEGKLIKEYLLYLWDVVSYSYTNSYNYNASGQISEIIKMQEILRIYPKDEEYIDSFGDMPVNEKIVYTYNDEGQLVKKEIFVFHSDHMSDDQPANQTINYEYEDGRLVAEQSISPESRIFNYNYTISYDYDSLGRLIRKLREFGTEKPMTRETRFVYDSTGFVVEKKVIDQSVPHNNSYEKYGYDSLGRKASLSLYSKEDEEFQIETTYQYDEQNKMIAGDRDVKYEYFDNGLISSESWIDPKTNQKVVFKTEYEYF